MYSIGQSAIRGQWMCSGAELGLAEECFGNILPAGSRLHTHGSPRVRFPGGILSRNSRLQICLVNPMGMLSRGDLLQIESPYGLHPFLHAPFCIWFSCTPYPKPPSYSYLQSTRTEYFRPKAFPSHSLESWSPHNCPSEPSGSPPTGKFLLRHRSGLVLGTLLLLSIILSSYSGIPPSPPRRRKVSSFLGLKSFCRPKL